MKNKEKINFILSLGIIFVLIFFIFYVPITNAYRTGYNLNNDPFGSALAKTSPNDFIKDSGAKALKTVFIELLIGILTVIGWLLSAAISIFSWAVDANVFNAVLANNGAIYQTWQKVRDLLNIAFILVLLFSAFATIFQVEKYNYKKILLMVVLMALLVNFSFPIARFIIDVSNSLMYTLINNLGIFPAETTSSALGSSSLFTRFSHYTDINNFLTKDAQGNISSLIAAIVFLFILMMTFMIMAVLFLIRVIALAIIVVFSPIAFIGAILPNSLGSGKWWDYLFKYSFFGPVMIFMVYVAQQMMVATSSTYANIINSARINTPIGDLVSSMAIFAIPITILWIGMGVANSMSIAGAGAVTSQAKKWGKWLAQRPQKGLGWVSKKAGITDGVKARYDKFKKSGLLGTDKVEEGAARIAALGGKNAVGKFFGGDADAHKKLIQKRNREKIKTEEENNAGEKSSNLYTVIQENAKNPTGVGLSDKEKIQAAGRVKNAMTRGKEFENYIEEAANENTTISALGNKMKSIKIDENSSPGQIEQRRLAEKEYNDAVSKFKQEQFELYRQIIHTGENVGTEMTKKVSQQTTKAN